MDRARGKQIIDFSGVRYGRITPTDIDGFIDYRDRVRIFLEYKYKGEELPHGQRLAFVRLVDDEERIGKTAVLFVIEHSTPPAEDIDGANATVREYYTNGAWHDGAGHTAKELIDMFIIKE